MYLSCTAAVVLLVIAGTAAQLQWDLNDWSPIYGKCKTCEKGKMVYLGQGRSSQISSDLVGQESERLESHIPSKGFSVIPANVFPLKGSQSSVRNNGIQLVYLPEGSINDLRNAQLAKVKPRGGNVQFRPARASSFAFDAPVSDMEVSESSLSFKEISPRRPTALVAEAGRELEAYEQIQLLETALNSHPKDVQDGDLPRVFIAPTHLPPPPGYVKIPLLPSQNHVQNKEVLPQTFLTSEFHKGLPPGFVQVPLPERVAQLSHGIPFVNPNQHPHFSGSSQRQQPQDQHLNRGNFVQQHFGVVQPTPQNIRIEQDSNRARQPAQEFNRGQTIQQQAPQNFNRGQTIQQQAPQNFNRGQTIQQQTFNIGAFEPENIQVHSTPQQNPNFIPIPPAHLQNPLRIPSHPHEARDQIQDDNKEQRNRQHPVNQDGRQQSVPEPASPNRPISNVEQPSQRAKSPAFFDIGSSVINPTNNFDDYSHFQVPNFGGDYEQDFDVYDNQGFEIPNVISDFENGKVSDEKSKVEKPALVTTEKEIAIEETPAQETFEEEIIPVQETLLTKAPVTDATVNEIPVELTTTEETKKQEDDSLVPDQSEKELSPTSLISDDSLTIKNTDFQLLPKPLESFPSLSPSPVESNVVQSPEKTTESPSDLQDITTTPIKIQLSPIPVDEPTTTSVPQIIKPQRPHSRRRLRPSSSRGRIRHRLVPQTHGNVRNEVSTTSSSIDLTDEAHSVPTQTTPLPVPTTLRSRFNLSTRRRRPLRKGVTPQKNVVTETSESSTLFPPFSVAKKINTGSESRPTSIDGKRKKLSSLRGRFGSRIRPQTQDVSANTDDTNTVEAKSPEEVVQSAPANSSRRRRIRPKARVGPNGKVLRQRRRRILHRVRKVKPSTTENSLVKNQFQKDNELSGAESARVSLVSDPIAQTLDLINEKETSPDTKLEDADNVGKSEPPKENVNTEENLNQQPLGSQATEKSPENIFSLLNLGNTNSESIPKPTVIENVSEDQPLVHLNVSPFKTNDDGYVNDRESNSRPLDTPQALPLRSDIAPVDIDLVEHDTFPLDSLSPSSEPSLFDSFIDSISDSDATQEPIPNAQVESESENSDLSTDSLNESTLLVPESTIVNENENLPAPNDRSDNILETLSPEGTPDTQNTQDSFYDDYDSEGYLLDNGTFVGSRSRVVYAVALSESPPENVSENDFSTQSMIEEESNVATTTTQYEEKENIISTTSTVASTNADVLTIEAEAAQNLDSTSEAETQAPSSVSDIIDENSELESEVILDNLATQSDFPEDSPRLQTESVYENTVGDSEFATEAKDSSIHLETANENLDMESKSIDDSVIPFEVTEDSETISATSNPVSENTDFLETPDETDADDATTQVYFDSSDYDTSDLTLGTENELDVSSRTEENSIATEQNKIDTTTQSTSEDPMPTDVKTNVEEISLAKSLSNRKRKKLEKAADGSFLGTFFSADSKPAKDKESTVEKESGKRIIGTSTITEVRSSAPVICVDGNCVISPGFRRRRGS